MVGVTRIKIRETVTELEALIQQQSHPNLKERLQVLYLLQLPDAMSISAIAKVVGRHRGSVQRWLSQYRETGLNGLLETHQSPGRPQVIPTWAVASLKRRLDDPETGFGSYTQVQQWLSETLNVEAEYATVHHLVRYRLGAKLKAARPVHAKQNPEALTAFKQTSATTSSC
ncbi:helix-turn-helix domain-containing protein (plasmid) [Phormidium sp. CLA17]|uniref:helix-turn-helix domain-containing protein n=1 Tax=Leptolyngbya sp. Cla-17 TaxID=2803751 RepID=UPI0014922EB4|nr:helix-turn-helix domain-containing protein [Leptolyngbya sp. Cla-17]MBM0745651.1 helix-turn-helix domain-containing protein [Leptolyngbya sp. Cla-17]